MTATKHFTYEASVELKTNVPENFEIKDVVFLTPARVKFLENGSEYEIIVSVDFVNRKVYYGNDSKPDILSEAFFRYLDSVNSLPEDLFVAPPHVVERAAEMQAEQGRIREQMGVSNG